MVNSASTRDYTRLDHPSILAALFHPRPALGARRAAGTAHDFLIPADHNDLLFVARDRYMDAIATLCADLA
jgi:hypothetical protein